MPTEVREDPRELSAAHCDAASLPERSVSPVEVVKISRYLLARRSDYSGSKKSKSSKNKLVLQRMTRMHLGESLGRPCHVMRGWLRNSIQHKTPPSL
jgi:hypothetical protein